MSLGGLLLKPVVWELASVDDGKVLKGQFRPEALTENISANYAEVNTLGLGQPVLQFINGALDTISFTARCWAYSQGLLGTGFGKNVLAKDDIEEMVTEIKNTCRVDPSLGRPHIFVLTIGEKFSQQVVVRSVGGITYDNMRPSGGGSLRGVTFSMDCARYVTFGESATTAESESLIYRAKTGDFYEAITAQLYSRPMLGEVLRRRNPEYRDLAEGTEIHVPPARTLGKELVLKEQSTPLKSTKASDALRESNFDKRSGPWITTLPEGY